MVMNFPLETMKQWLNAYRYTIVYKVLPPKFDNVPDAGPINLDTYYTLGGQEPPDKAMLARNIIHLRIITEMDRRISATAFYMGYLHTARVSAGPCLVTKCADKGKCASLEQGGHCPFLDVEPCGQGVAYIDYNTLGRQLGWGAMQPDGNCSFPEDAPNPEEYYNIGITLVD